MIKAVANRIWFRVGVGRAATTFACALLVGILAGPVSSAGALTPHSVVKGFSVTKLANEAPGATHCDDLAFLGGNLYLGCQNKTTSAGGGGNSTLAEYSTSGSLVKTWSLSHKIDGLCADNSHHQLIITQNEDSNSLIRTLAPSTGQLVTYTYSPNPDSPSAPKALYTHGGTDSCNVDAAGHILVVGSHALFATGTTVFAVTLHPSNKTATLKPTFLDNVTATNAISGGSTKLNLIDADSSTIVPKSVPKFGGDYMVTDQTSFLLVFAHDLFKGSGVSYIKLATGLDDPQFTTSSGGTLYVANLLTTTGGPAIYKISGPFTSGTLYASDDGISDEIVQVNLTTGKETPFVRGLVTTKGLVYVDASGTNSNLPLNGASAVPTSSSSSSSGGGISTGLLIVIIAAAVVLIGGGALAVRRRAQPNT